MTRLPTGTVTFLFTDVEGSTKLLEQLGEPYHHMQDRHASILRRAVSEGGGSVVSTEGDSFFAVFPDARHAVSAAVQAQRELAAAPWPAGVRLRVRMGLHTGAGIVGGDNYLGLDVNRAARIAAAAHGEQILLSDATQSLVERCLPPETRLRGLGQHRLKDLTEPERLYQAVIDGLEQDFPPPRTVNVRPNNLPVQLTNFIGRSREVARLRELLGVNRLLTLTGTGGTGKTRLALQVAGESLLDFADGVFFVDLAPIEDDRLVASATISATARAICTPGSTIHRLTCDSPTRHSPSSENWATRLLSPPQSRT
jgi:class 3 adenylate cyclase